MTAAQFHYSPTNLPLLGFRENSTGYPLVGLTPISTTERISGSLMAVPFTTFVQPFADPFQAYFYISPFFLINSDLPSSIILSRFLLFSDFSNDSDAVNLLPPSSFTLSTPHPTILVTARKPSSVRSITSAVLLTLITSALRWSRLVRYRVEVTSLPVS